MGGYSQSQPWDEKVPGVDVMGGMPRPKRGLLGALLNIGDQGGEWNEQTPTYGTSTSSAPMVQHRVEDDRNLSPRGGQGPQGNQPPDDHLARMQAEYDRLGQPPANPYAGMSLKQKMLQSLRTAAPLALGAAFGGSAGLEGAAQGEEAAIQRQQQQRNIQQQRVDQQRGRLLQEIEAERRTQEMERAATQRSQIESQNLDKRLTLQQQMEQDRFNQQNQLESQREQQRQTLQKQMFDEQNQRQQAQFGEQEKLQGMRDAAADRRQQSAIDRMGTNTASKRYETAMDADQRLSRMESAYGKGLKGDQQAMLSLLTDHIGMTLGMQKGARITKDILNEAQASQPWLAKIGAKFDDRGYLSGVTLGPDQMRQMLDLGYEARDRAVQGAYDDSALYGVAEPKGARAVFGKRNFGDKPALQNSQQPVYATNPKTKQRVMTTDGGKTWQPAQ